jgi:hypothetical protein
MYIYLGYVISLQGFDHGQNHRDSDINTVASGVLKYFLPDVVAWKVDCVLMQECS